MMSLLEQIAEGIEQIRIRKPIVHHITNYISINDCANITLAIGASPIMANDPVEVQEVVAQSAALVLNLGTPNTRMLESMLLAGKKANAMGIPVILDPVGVGFTQVRTRTVEQIALCIRLTAVRGNLAEIQRMTGVYAAMRGIDSLASAENAAEIVRQAAQQMGCLVAATGPTDFVSDGRTICRVGNGDAMMSRVTGTGCMTTSLVASCCGAMGASMSAVTAGVMLMGIAGEMACASLLPGEGTGSFRTRLVDAVSILTAEDVLRQGRCSVE
ncbi:MAG: hydroxyethylthiazole kinase [Firmicutes bacterium]|nr:hydroxyethylthiazole kinase [Bacillota bacterium]